VKEVGLVNFDTEHMDEIIESGVSVVSNQVQVSHHSSHSHFQISLQIHFLVAILES
jgi:diketogulonate reductase-like aldo/keto reductase